MSENRKPSYWAVLPAVVRYDANLKPNAKLLYAEISSLCDAQGYCFASNKYFAQNFELDPTTIQRLIKALVDRGYISVEVERDKTTNEVVARRIFAGINPAGAFAPPSPQNCGDPSPQKCGDPSPQNCGIEQSTYIINTPLPPKGGQESAIYSLPLKDGTVYKVSQLELDHWRSVFPSVDVDQQFRSMRAWLEASPDRLKTRRGIKRFIVSWLSRRADKAPVKAEGGGGLGKLVL